MGFERGLRTRTSRSGTGVTTASATGAAPPVASSGPASARPRGERLGSWLERWGVLLTFGVMLVVFSLLSPDVFPSWRNAVSIFEQTSIVILLAVGLTFVLAAGEFDLSFPQTFVLVTGLAVVALTRWDMGPLGAVAVAMATGLAAGLINGLLVATKRASSFIVTLAVGSVYAGIMYAVAGEGPIVKDIPAGYIDISGFHIGDITAVILVAVVVAAVGGIVLRASVFGRHVQATGSNAEAAAVSGVKVTAVRVGAFVVLGACIAIAAIMQSSISGAHYPTAGQGLFLPPFVAAFIGTSVLARGQFNVFGTVVGALFISTLQTGLLLQNMPAWVINVVQGVVLLLAVLVAAQTKRRRR